MTIYNEIIHFLKQEGIKNHPDLAGIVLLGSFSANQGDELSDIDIDFIYDKEGFVPVQLPVNNWEWDINEKLLDGYPGFAREDWQCGAYVTAEVIFDKTDGVIENNIKELVAPGFDYFKPNLGYALDGYYNAYYRAMKCLRRDNIFGAHLMACMSMDILNTILYQINGLVQTYPNRLPAMIDKMNTLPMSMDELLSQMNNVAIHADGHSQVQIYLAVKKMMGELGYDDVYESWEGKLDQEVALLR